MPKTTDTYARAYEACATVFTELARFPTIELIRERIGVNSPTLIKRAITDWTLEFAERHREKMTRPDLPNSLLEATENLWKLALLEAQRTFQQDRQAWAEEKDRLDKTLTETHQLHETLTQDLKASRQAADDVRLSYQAQIEEIRRQLEQECKARSEVEEALVTNRSELEILRATLAAEREQFAERRKEWEHRLDAQHIWHLQRIEEEKNQLRKVQQRELAQRDADISRLTLECQRFEACAKALQEQTAEWRGRLSATEENLSVTRELLTDKNRELAELHAQLASTWSALEQARQPNDLLEPP